jgi:alkylation response protein AidB-like acyl-CoA dehydrogenase
MDFGLSEEQRLLEASLRRFLETERPVARVREIIATPEGRDDALWQALAGMGVLGVLVPEEHGGSGLGLLDAAVAAEVLGRCIAPAPFLGTAVMAAVAIAAAGTPAQQKEWLPKIAGGGLRIGVAATELFAPRDEAALRVQAGRLVGQALMVVDGAADAYLVPVGRESLVLVPRGAPGLALELLPTIDRTRRFAELVAEGVGPVEWIGGPGAAATGIQRMVDAGRVAVAADVLGACETAIERSVAYAQQRVQFGRTIGSFQAVKHLCAEMVAELEPARSLVWYAAHAFEAIPREASLLAAHAKAHLCEIGTRIVRTATEVHGGIGFTDAHDLHLWFKRVGVDRQLLGTPDGAREDAARLQGWA